MSQYIPQWPKYVSSLKNILNRLITKVTTQHYGGPKEQKKPWLYLLLFVILGGNIILLVSLIYIYKYIYIYIFKMVFTYLNML